MKKQFVLVLILIFLSTVFLSAINTPWLHTDGRNIKDPEGNEVILRGLNFVSIWVTTQREGPRASFYPHADETDDGLANLKAVIDLATDKSKGWHTTVLRFPVYPWKVDIDPGWVNCSASQLKRYKKILDVAINYATSKGVYVIIDWHYVHHYSDKLDECMDFWDYAVDRYKHMSNVMFELYNEPIAYKQTFVPDEPNYSWKDWKDTIAQPLVDRIRNHHKAKNIIIVGGPRWSQLLGGAADDPVIGSNIVYACHIYPYHYENQGSNDPVGDLSSYVGETINKYPIFFTEWGFQDGGAIPCDALNEDVYAAGMKQYLIDQRTSWCAWVFDPWWEPIMFDNWDYIGLLGKSLPATGGYMGQMVNDFLTEFKDHDLPGGSSNNFSPTCTLKSPLDGAVYDEGETIIIKAEANDKDGTVVSVEYFVNEIKVGSGTQAAWPVTPGAHVIYAKATDDKGASTKSTSVTIAGKMIVTGDIKAAWAGNTWETGFSGNITITNESNVTINGWIVTFTFTDGSKITSHWNAKGGQTGATCTFENLDWNGVIQPGKTRDFGVKGTHQGNFQFPNTITVTPR